MLQVLAARARHDGMAPSFRKRCVTVLTISRRGARRAGGAQAGRGVGTTTRAAATIRTTGHGSRGVSDPALWRGTNIEGSRGGRSRPGCSCLAAPGWTSAQQDRRASPLRNHQLPTTCSPVIADPGTLRAPRTHRPGGRWLRLSAPSPRSTYAEPTKGRDADTSAAARLPIRPVRRASASPKYGRRSRENRVAVLLPHSVERPNRGVELANALGNCGSSPRPPSTSVVGRNTRQLLPRIHAQRHGHLLTSREPNVAGTPNVPGRAGEAPAPEARETARHVEDERSTGASRSIR